VSALFLFVILSVAKNRQVKIMDYLYRYRPFEEESAKETFTHGILYFISPKDFNDPFDCKTSFAMKESSDADFEKLFTTSMKADKPESSESEIKKTFDEIRRGQGWRDNFQKVFRETAESLAEPLGMLCLSEERNNILLWSHYADGHKGYCLEFNKSKIEQTPNYCKPVNYRKGDNYPTLKEYVSLSLEEKDRFFLLNKSEHWGYEKEWRIIIDPNNGMDGKRKLKFREEFLTGVIFGCEMLDDNKKKIRTWLEGRKSTMKIYQAIKSRDRYAIEIVEAT
jgi:Protein of unknown function (DUF2971)